MSEENTSAGSATVEPIPDGPIGGVPLAKPIHIQRLEQAVNLKSFLDFVDQCMDEPKLWVKYIPWIMGCECNN